MERFLAGVERRISRIARFATRQTDDALDLAQAAITRLVERYAPHPQTE